MHTGGTAMMVYDYTRINKSKIKFYLVDTFTGLVKNLISKEELKEWNKSKKNPVDHYVEDVEKITRQKFKNYKNVKIIKGEIPKVLKKIKTKKISYLHIYLLCFVMALTAAVELISIGSVYPLMSSALLSQDNAIF